MKALLRSATAVTAMTALLAGAGTPATAAVLPAVPTVSAVVPAKISTVGGATVTITGKNFIGVENVTFGDAAAAAFTVASTTKITAIAPAGVNGAAPITVISAAGASVASTRSRVTYRNPLGIDPAGNLAAKASGGPLVLTVTGGTLGANSKAFAAEIFSVLLNNKTKLTATYVDASRLKVTVPASVTETAELAVVHDTIPGDPAPITLVPVVTALSVRTSPVGGGLPVTVKVAGMNPAAASDFMFGDAPATCTVVKAPTFSCTVPPAAQAGPVTVTFRSGSGALSRFTAAAAFAYTDN